MSFCSQVKQWLSPKQLASASALWMLLTMPHAHSDTVHVAVAANFTAAAKAIAAAFAETSGHRAVLSFGSTGKLYTQIVNGAPFQVFLAADQVRPERAIKDGVADPGSRFTYARGRIALFSSDPNLINGQAAVLNTPDLFGKLAIANPKLAPYGAAAMETLQATGHLPAVRKRLVMGENIAQTYQFVSTGNASLGFVALAQIDRTVSGSYWVVPEHLYTPIKQDAVLLRKGVNHAAAIAFIKFLRSPEALNIVAQFGYGTGELMVAQQDTGEQSLR